MDAFTLRRRVRDALRTLEEGDEVQAELRALHDAYASAVEEALDASEKQSPASVASARQALGLVSGDSVALASELIEAWENASGVEACQIALKVIGVERRLSGLARALLEDPGPAAGGVLALARSLASDESQRRALAVALARRQMRGGAVEEVWVVRRQGVRLLGARRSDREVVVGWREVPGHGLIARFDVDLGLKSLEPAPEAEVIDRLEGVDGDRLELAGLRTLWAASIQPSTLADHSRTVFSSLIDARLFPNAGGGHAVGAPYASMLLETLAGAVESGTMSPSDLAWPGSEAEAFLDLYGLRGLTRLLLLDRGAGELVAKLERLGDGTSGRGWVESSPPNAGIASRVVLSARVEDDVWWLTRFELSDPAPALAAARWNGEALIPIQDYDGLEEDEQELAAGMADGGVSLGMIASALASLRSRPRSDSAPELRAAYAHAEALGGVEVALHFAAVAPSYGVDEEMLQRYDKTLGREADAG